MNEASATTPEHFLAAVTAQGCLLEAIAKTHPEPLKLMEHYLRAVERTAKLFANTQSQHAQDAFQYYATSVEKWIPG